MKEKRKVYACFICIVIISKYELMNFHNLTVENIKKSGFSRACNLNRGSCIHMRFCKEGSLYILSVISNLFSIFPTGL